MRIAAAAFVALGLLLLPSGAIESGKADSTPTCTHGLSSVGPVYFRDGVITGQTTPTTEACLP